MNCEKALELMSAELDGALTEEETKALRAHLDACPDCQEVRRQLHEMDTLLQESELEPPAALHDGVMREIRQEKKPKKHHTWIPAAAIAAAAALVLLAGRAGILALPGFERDSTVTVNIGSAAEQIFTHTRLREPDPAAAQQAAELSARTWLDVVLVWGRGVPAELESAAYEDAENGARQYRVTGALAQTLLDAYNAALYAPDSDFSDLPEKPEARVLVFE